MGDSARLDLIVERPDGLPVEVVGPDRVFDSGRHRGSGIANRPYGKIYGGAPGAVGPSSGPSGKDHQQAYSGRGMR